MPGWAAAGPTQLHVHVPPGGMQTNPGTVDGRASIVDGVTNRSDHPIADGYSVSLGSGTLARLLLQNVFVAANFPHAVFSASKQRSAMKILLYSS